MPHRYMPPYNAQELEVMLSGINSGTPISDLESSLEGRSAVGIVKKLEKLSREDPDKWDPEKIRPYIAQMNSNSWKTARTDPDKVQQSKQRVVDFLRENPDASRTDLDNVGLTYDLSVGYDHRINEAKKSLDITTRRYGGQLIFTKEQRKKRIIDYLRGHTDANTRDLRKAGYNIEHVDENIYDLRRQAGIIPRNYIQAAAAARRLDTYNERVSILFRSNKLKGIKVGRSMYISTKSIENYEAKNPTPTLEQVSK